MKFFFTITGMLFIYLLQGQSYIDSLTMFRSNYIQEFRTDEKSPLKEKQLKHLQFFPIDSTYRIIGKFKRTSDEKAFDLPTSSGKTKEYVKYGVVTFLLSGTTCTLSVYQSLSLRNIPEYKDHLFIPFNDDTNYEETYGGGRYLDVSINDIHDETLLIDFNKCYNPYCAYTDGYSCPVPPAENKLSIPIKAGEKTFGGKSH